MSTTASLNQSQILSNYERTGILRSKSNFGSVLKVRSGPSNVSKRRDRFGMPIVPKCKLHKVSFAPEIETVIEGKVIPKFTVENWKEYNVLHDGGCYQGDCTLI